MLPVKLASANWVHTNGRQQVISVMESPKNTICNENRLLYLPDSEREVALTDLGFLRRSNSSKAGGDEQ